MTLPVILLGISYTAFSFVLDLQLPFACDQILGRSSLFHWYYWTRNAGAAFSFVVNFSFSYVHVDDLCLVSLMSLAAASTA